MTNLNLKDLHFFLVVAEEEHMHRAARRLAIAQPALSRHIRDLESALGIELFDRRNQRIKLSSSGKAFIEYARNVLAAADLATQKAGNISRGLSGKLRIGLSESSIRCPPVRDAILKFSRRYRQVELEFVPIVRAPLLGDLESDAVDIAFIPHTTPEMPAFPCHEICQIGFVLAMPVDHALAAHECLSIHDLDGEELLWLEPNSAPGVTRIINRRFEEARIRVRLRPVEMSEVGKLHLVAAGIGIALMSSTISNELPEFVRFKEISDLNVSINIMAVWKNKYHNPALHNLISYIF